MWMPSICTTMIVEARTDRRPAVRCVRSSRATAHEVLVRPPISSTNAALVGAGRSHTGSRVARRNFQRRDVAQRSRHRPLAEPVRRDRSYAHDLQRQLAEPRDRARATARNVALPRITADLDLGYGVSGGQAVPQLRAVPSSTKLLSVLLQRRPTRIRRRGEASTAIEACRHLEPSFRPEHRRIRRRLGDRCCVNSFHALLSVREISTPSLLGSMRATPLAPMSTFSGAIRSACKRRRATSDLDA